MVHKQLSIDKQLIAWAYNIIMHVAKLWETVHESQFSLPGSDAHALFIFKLLQQ